MATREEIREGIYYVPQSNHPDIQEGIAKWLHGASTNPWKEPSWEDIPEWRRDQYRKNAYFLMVKLDGKGVAIIVNRELPSVFDADENVISAIEYKKKLEGYVATESLVEG